MNEINLKSMVKLLLFIFIVFGLIFIFDIIIKQCSPAEYRVRIIENKELTENINFCKSYADSFTTWRADMIAENTALKDSLKKQRKLIDSLLLYQDAFNEEYPFIKNRVIEKMHEIEDNTPIY